MAKMREQNGEWFNSKRHVGETCPTCMSRPCVEIDNDADPPLCRACKLQWAADRWPPTPRFARIRARAADVLGWSVRDTQSFSLSWLRDAVRDKGTLGKHLAEHISDVIRRGEHITGEV